MKKNVKKKLRTTQFEFKPNETYGDIIDAEIVKKALTQQQVSFSKYFEYKNQYIDKQINSIAVISLGDPQLDKFMSFIPHKECSAKSCICDKLFKKHLPPFYGKSMMGTPKGEPVLYRLEVFPLSSSLH